MTRICVCCIVRRRNKWKETSGLKRWKLPLLYELDFTFEVVLDILGISKQESTLHWESWWTIGAIILRQRYCRLHYGDIFYPICSCFDVSCLRFSRLVADVKFKENPEEKRDVYCTISCDATQLARTPTIYQTEKPVFLEEYDLYDELLRARLILILSYCIIFNFTFFVWLLEFLFYFLDVLLLTL